ncbi:MAG: sigma-70 family RNA polymerase sigma factor [Actinophytocola sp.]|nr:sigma-70 family RNA polymerase sigma factor [Actinophytocola sp.]
MLTPRLRAVLRRCRLSEADIDDVLQDVWLRFLEHRHAIRHPERVAGWLRTTAVREAMRALGRCRTERPSADVTAGATPSVTIGVTTGVTPETAGSPGEDVARRDRDQTLWRAVATLPARDRLLAHLIARAPGLSYADLATTLGVTQASVGQLRARCLRRLRRALLLAGITAP